MPIINCMNYSCSGTGRVIESPMVANGGGAIMEELLMGSMSGSDGRSDI